MLAYKDGARVRLISRNAVDHTLPIGISSRRSSVTGRTYWP
jgi:hypothetical protein